MHAHGVISDTEEKEVEVWQILLIILAVLIAVLVVLYFMGKRLQKRQAEQKEQIEAAKQQMTLLIIDKKRMRVTESGLPQAVIDQVPKLMRRSKLPVVKVKAGPRVMTMIADEAIFDIIPVKKEVKATVSGIYITDVKAVRGKLPVPEKKEKGIRGKIAALRKKASAKADAAADAAASAKKSRKK